MNIILWLSLGQPAPAPCECPCHRHHDAAPDSPARGARVLTADEERILESNRYFRQDLGRELDRAARANAAYERRTGRKVDPYDMPN